MVNSLRRLSRIFLSSILLAWLPFGAGAAEITVAMDPDPPVPGESFRLAFTATGDVDGEPDFKPLEKRFEILGRNQQTSLRSINGRYTRTSSWILEVLARDDGPLRVPPIAFGADRSPPLTRAVDRAPTAPTQDEGLFLEVEATPSDPYVQQQVTYTIRLWRRYELSNASLSEPRLDQDAVVRPLGEDRQYQDERNGLRYEVIERRFAIFPQASGSATLAPVTVTAQVMERASSLFELFGRAVRTRRISSAAIELEVRPVPQRFPAGATWLPAPRVRLNELWSPDEGAVRVGDPVTRTVSLWVSGQTSGQLPELLPASVPGLKVYADQPQMKDEAQDGAINAVRQEKAALVAEAAGTVTVPALALPWWNTVTDSLEYARLPARVLEVAATAADPAGPPPPTTEVAAPAPSQGALTATPAEADWLSWRGWFPLACVATAGWLVTLAGLRRRKKQASDARRQPSPPEATSLTLARRAVTDAARAGDPDGAASALLAWARLSWPAAPPLSLGALARRVPEPLAREIGRLEAARHARAPLAWQGSALCDAFTATRPGEPPAPAALGHLPEIFRLAR